jgi:hypothetical protein
MPDVIRFDKTADAESFADAADVATFDEAGSAPLATAESSTPPGKDYLDHLKKINDVFYDQVKIADQKAAYVFTFMIAFMVTSAEGRAVFQWRRYTESFDPQVLFPALFALSAVTAAVSAILVVLPRSVGRTTSLFWGAWSKHRGEIIAAGERFDSNYLFNEYLGNIDNLAVIARAKYRFVTLAFRSLVVMVIAYLLMLMTK